MTAETDPFEGLTLGPLGPEDVARGAALSAEIGWNQNAADWRYMLENGFGYGRTDPGGKLVGTALALGYGSFAWVCMVLVSPDRRRRGLATDLMGRVLDDLEARGIVAGLDATPDGRKVYKPLGFQDVYEIDRLWAERVRPAPSGGSAAVIAPLQPGEIEEITKYDSRTFGAERGELLAALRDRQPGRAFVARIGEWPAGFVLAREGRQATQIGPLVAEDPDIAIALAGRALDGLSGPAVIDSPSRQIPFIEWIKASGFDFQRPYIRMLRGRSAPIDEQDFVYALAGPELG